MLPPGATFIALSIEPHFQLELYRGRKHRFNTVIPSDTQMSFTSFNFPGAASFFLLCLPIAGVRRPIRISGFKLR